MVSFLAWYYINNSFLYGLLNEAYLHVLLGLLVRLEDRRRVVVHPKGEGRGLTLVSLRWWMGGLCKNGSKRDVQCLNKEERFQSVKRTLLRWRGRNTTIFGLGWASSGRNPFLSHLSSCRKEKPPPPCCFQMAFFSKATTIHGVAWRSEGRQGTPKTPRL